MLKKNSGLNYKKLSPLLNVLLIGSTRIRLQRPVMNASSSNHRMLQNVRMTASRSIYGICLAPRLTLHDEEGLITV